eukprot:CAMPEP_0204449484 /NCGR_PEP_ID=MMETSP0470-20130426/99860_1 /ASSEMBLY_ACC=CAM_ASM_000385 /TAXON_ID=2969 /ORGANISM="Oxyrrhis marina" /LENGTH=439 /DNA_ID=CAMNT_0051449303 /DNA_START=337 /DNA_END=1653 /DNA_ORIENTATION=-
MGFLGQHISRPGKNFAPREPHWRRRVVAEALADASVVMRLAQLESQAKSMIGTKLSPDAKSVISDVLLPVIKDEIESAISREFVSVQEQLADLVDGLEVKTQQAVTSKAAADTSDNKLDTCRSNEKTALDQYETCEVDRAAKIVSDAQHCQTKRDAALQTCAEKDVAADVSFSDLCAPTQCNLADGHMCNMEEFTKAVEGMNAMVQQKNDAYLLKTQECNDANKMAADVCSAAEQFSASDSCKEKRELAQHQQAQCEAGYGQAKVAICSFGSALQGKCVDLSEVRSLIAKIKASDRKDSLSESDSALPDEARRSAADLAEKDAAADLSFSDLCAPTQCNLADGNMCNIEEFTKAVEGMNAIVKQKHDDYLEKIQQCNEADKVALDVCAAAEEFAASDSCKEEREQAQHQQVQCESDYGQAKVAICSFGSALQGKCVDLS